MSVLMMALLASLFGSPAGLADKYYVRITDPADLPDMQAWTPRLPDGSRGGLFYTGKYGWDPGRGDLHGADKVAAVIARLGPPMAFMEYDTPMRGYMWRRKEPDKPHAGIAIYIDERFSSVKLRVWGILGAAKGYTGRVGVAGENEIYRWFAWLVSPLTPEEQAAVRARAVGEAPAGDEVKR